MTDNASKISYLADIKAASVAIRRCIADADGPLPPHFLVEFLLSQWRRYLAMVHHHQGEASVEWSHAVDATRRLLFSVLPITSIEQRTKLRKSLPQLVADLKKGTQVGHIEPATRDLFLKQLSEYHIVKLDSKRPLDSAHSNDLSDTISMDTRDPRYRALLDKLDGADGVEHIEM